MDKKMGPDSRGIFRSPLRGSFVMPERLRRLFVRLLDHDPLKRPTAQEAAQELCEIRDL